VLDCCAGAGLAGVLELDCCAGAGLAGVLDCCAGAGLAGVLELDGLEELDCCWSALDCLEPECRTAALLDCLEPECRTAGGLEELDCWRRWTAGVRWTAGLLDCRSAGLLEAAAALESGERQLEAAAALESGELESGELERAARF
jgi:hypothetical protein